MSELFGINHTNMKSVMNKNMFTTFFPIATALYMSSKNIPLKYIRVDDHNSLEIVEIQFEDILGVNKTDVNRIKWKSGTCPSMFNHSANPPHVDMVPELDDAEILEFEVKLTVVPTVQAQPLISLVKFGQLVQKI